MYSASIVETAISVCNLDTQWAVSFNCHLKFIFEQFRHIFNLNLVWCNPNYIINISKTKYFTFLVHRKALIHGAYKESSAFEMFLQMFKQTHGSLAQAIETFVHLQNIFIVNISSCEISWNFHVDLFFLWSLCESIHIVHLNCCPSENDRYDYD